MLKLREEVHKPTETVEIHEPMDILGGDYTSMTWNELIQELKIAVDKMASITTKANNNGGLSKITKSDLEDLAERSKEHREISAELTRRSNWVAEFADPTRKEAIKAWRYELQPKDLQLVEG